MSFKKPMRYFTIKGEEVDYDYFKRCFSTFDNLVIKANNIIPNGIEGDFIKYLLRDGKYKQGGWMVKPDGSKIRLYYAAWLYQLLLMRDSSGFYMKNSKGEYMWKPKAKEYYDNWKANKIAQEKFNDTQKYNNFIKNISRYDSEYKNDGEED